MKKLLSTLAAIGWVAAFAIPVSAAPIFVPRPEQVQTNTTIEQVNHWRHRHWRADRRWDRRWDRRHAWRSCGYYGRCYPRHYGYYGGYRDHYRYHRRSGVTIYFNF
ncbi:hypothetical protein J2Z19_006413 [Ensifer adhaerens]|uniref:Uncharacterized protein n=1 Tax=Ensifer adhaerens TaxID=106592 RepID=A0ACC5T687_ENSAD|nr:hypothetical protein [Ensifer adhaerens]MBP1876661.1 hypothetical protein [Ensifer adhaerens]